MKAYLTQVLAGVFALSAFSLLGCTSDTGGTPSGTGSGGSQGGTTTASGGAGGASTTPANSGGVATSGGTPASGGQTPSQGGTPAQGGSASGGTTTSTGGQPVTGGSASGGRASGGAASGGSATGGSATGGSVAGGSATGGGATGGKTSTGGAATGGVSTGGKTSTGGTASGGAASGGATATGGSSIGGSSGKITVWMSGDSTMSGGSSCTGACPCGWGTQFSQVFNSNVTIQNLAVAGRSIQTWLYEGAVGSSAGAGGECTLSSNTYSANWNAMLTGMKPGDYLFIEFGINDGSACPRHVGTALFQTYLATMAKAASDRGAQAIFLSPTNAIACSGSTAQANTRGQYPAATQAAATTANVPYIDVTALSAALYTSAGLCPNSGDYTSTTSKVGQFFCGDHTHFEAAGGLEISKMVAKALKDQGIGLAAYLIN
jgi:lysophospholipase L1-like esterase